MPTSITRDSGTEFKPQCFIGLCKLHKINLHYTTSRHSNSNSSVERFYSSLLEDIRVFGLENRNKISRKTPFDSVLGTHIFGVTDEIIIILSTIIMIAEID